MGSKKGRKQARRMTESEALMNQAQAQRLVKPVLIRGVELAKSVSLIQPKDFRKLNVDERYQRVRIGDEVNSLIHVLKAGGQIADAIDIAERSDGSLWIVDGQQRFWAHDECKLPIRAQVHRVDNIEAETNLFLALNARRRISARVMAKGWPGPVGDLLRKLNTDPKSPLFGLIDMASRSDLPLDAPTVVKGIVAVTTGLIPGGEMTTKVLPRADLALKVTGMTAWAEEFARLVAAVFDMNKGAGRVRMLPVVALGRVAHRKYTKAGRPVFPSSCAALRRCNWDTIVPTHANRYLPLLEGEMERRWKD